MERYSLKQGELFKKGDTFDLESLLKQEAIGIMIIMLADNDNTSVRVPKGRPYHTPISNVGFYIEKGGTMYAAVIDARHRTCQRRHDMAA